MAFSEKLNFMYFKIFLHSTNHQGCWNIWEQSGHFSPLTFGKNLLRRWVQKYERYINHISILGGRLHPPYRLGPTWFKNVPLGLIMLKSPRCIGKKIQAVTFDVKEDYVTYKKNIACSIGPFMSFYPNFIQILSRFFRNSIYPDFIQILS